MSTEAAPSLDDLVVLVEATNVEPQSSAIWHIAWTITNRSTHAVALHDVRIPHDQFRATDTALEQPVVIPPAASGTIASDVAFSEPPGSMLTYPFIILKARWQDVSYRIFGRLRVEADALGAPRPIVEEVTVRPAPAER